MESFSEGIITTITSLIHIITYYTNYINYDTYTYYMFYTYYTVYNFGNLWICLQSFRITNMPQVLDLILLTTKICLTELAHPRHPLLGPLGTYAILSVLPDKFARFLFEFHSGRFESLDLPILPDDRSDFDVHGALEDDKVKQLEQTCLI